MIKTIIAPNKLVRGSVNICITKQKNTLIEKE
jgi:hypothetical protein